MANRVRGPRRRKLSPAVKEHWFRRGAYALGCHFPRFKGKGYGCPICLRASRDVNLFTAEDVPLRKVGGRPLVLTCEPCNSRSGCQLDTHWAKLDDVEAFVRAELAQPLTAELRCGEAKTAVEITAGPGGYQTAIVQKASSQKAIDAQLEAFQLAHQQGEPARLHLTLNKSRYSEQRARLSVLRSAYLLSFSVMGYRFLGEWDRIRRQILAPAKIDEPLLRLVRYEPEHDRHARQLGIIWEPVTIRAMYVRFGRFAALIPLSRDSDLYRPSPQGGWNFAGHEYVWPDEPSFGLARESWDEADHSSV